MEFIFKIACQNIMWLLRCVIKETDSVNVLLICGKTKRNLKEKLKANYTRILTDNIPKCRTSPIKWNEMAAVLVRQ